MKTDFHDPVTLLDLEPSENFEKEFLRGLSKNPKTLPCKFFYDAQGSKLFDKICELEEYYPTRTENEILTTNIEEIASACGARCLLVELGSGSSNKTRLLLDHLESPVAYVPIDISRRHLMDAATRLSQDFFPLEILPVCADYHLPLTLPSPEKAPERTVIFFPGSTIGNLPPQDALHFLERIAAWCQPGDGLLVGVDLEKDKGILERAYNDSEGLTAAFNLNLLHRANRELDANFRVNQFRHRAFYNEPCSRIEMHLVSLREQTVKIAGRKICFDTNEPITTEYSHKYSVASFRKLARAAGWNPSKTWMDSRSWFSVHYLSLSL